MLQSTWNDDSAREWKLEQARLFFEQGRFQEAAVLYESLLKGDVSTESRSLRLIIDRQSRTVRTAEKWQITFGRQLVLFSMLEQLAKSPLGLSKAELARSIWGEQYRKCLHDNRIFYNINRLRRLIEANASAPRYILSTAKGYSVAPGVWIKIR